MVKQQLDRLGLHFHHLGLAVEGPELAKTFLQAIGYTLGMPVNDPQQRVNLIMCHHDTMPSVEIIYRQDSAGPLDHLLARNRNGLIYHLGYLTEDLDRALELMEEGLGLRVLCLSDPRPAVLFGGKHVSFYEIEGFGMIEIIEA